MNMPANPSSANRPRRSAGVTRSIVLLSLVAMISFFGYLKPSVFYFRTTNLVRDGKDPAFVVDARAILVTSRLIQYSHGKIGQVTGEPGLLDRPQFIWQRITPQPGGLQPPSGVPVDLKPRGFLGFGYFHDSFNILDAQFHSNRGFQSWLTLSLPTWFLGILAALPLAAHLWSRRTAAGNEQFEQKQSPLRTAA